jgi:hypothetical protein
MVNDLGHVMLKEWTLAGVNGSRVGNDILSPQLYHAATRHIVGLVEEITSLLATIPCCNEFRYKSMIQFATQGFVPFRGGGGHAVGTCKRDEDKVNWLRVARKRADGTAQISIKSPKPEEETS